MAIYTNNLVPSQLPFDTAPTLVSSLVESSVALRTLNVFPTTRHSVKFPIVGSTSSAVVAEGAEINPQDVPFTEVTSTPVKCASLIIASRESLSDNSEVSDLIADAITRSLGETLDRAVFGTVTGFAGLGSVTGYTTIDAGDAWDDTSPFISATYRANAQGANVNAFVANPDTCEALALLEQENGSKQKLLSALPSETGIVTTIAGVPLVSSSAVPSNTVWAVNDTHTHLVLRDDVAVEADKSQFFSSQRVACVGTIRASIAVTKPASLIKIVVTP